MTNIEFGFVKDQGNDSVPSLPFLCVGSSLTVFIMASCGYFFHRLNNPVIPLLLFRVLFLLFRPILVLFVFM